MQKSSVMTVEFQTLQNRTLDVIASEIITIERQVEQTALIGAVEIGNRLNEAKDMCEHGEFGDWCKGNLSYSQRKAERFMKLSEEYNAGNWIFSNSSISSNISVYKALSLLALPEEEAETFVEEHDVEEMSVKKLDEEIKKLKEEKAKTEEELSTKDRAAEELQREIEQLKNELKMKEAEQPETVDTSEYEEEIDKLKTSISEAEEKEKKLKEQFRLLEEAKQKDIYEAVVAEKESIYMQVKTEAEAEIEGLNRENEGLQAQVEGLQKKLMNNSAEGKLKFKILVDQLQDTFNECVNVISKEDEETAGKMKEAMKKVLRMMEEEL